MRANWRRSCVWPPPSPTRCHVFVKWSNRLDLSSFLNYISIFFKFFFWIFSARRKGFISAASGHNFIRSFRHHDNGGEQFNSSLDIDYRKWFGWFPTNRDDGIRWKCNPTITATKSRENCQNYPKILFKMEKIEDLLWNYRTNIKLGKIFFLLKEKSKYLLNLLSMNSMVLYFIEHF